MTQYRLGYCSKGFLTVPSRNYGKAYNNQLICSFFLHKSVPPGLTLPFQSYHILCYFRILLQGTGYSLLPEQAVNCISLSLFMQFSCQLCPFFARQKVSSRFQALMTIVWNSQTSFPLSHRKCVFRAFCV